MSSGLGDRSFSVERDQLQLVDLTGDVALETSQGVESRSAYYTAEAWTHVATRGDRSRRCSRVATPSPTGSGSSPPTSLAGSHCARTGHPSTVTLRPLHRIDPLAGLDDSPAFLGEPKINGCAEPFIRTLKEQCL